MSLALINTNTIKIVGNVPEGARFTLPNGDLVSPAYDGWASANGRFTLKTVVVPPAEPPVGKEIASTKVALVGDVPTLQYVYANIPPEAIPTSLTARQYFKQMRRDGRLAALRAWIATQDEDTQIDFEKSQTFEREDPRVRAAFVALTLTLAQRDAFYTAASKI